MADEIEEIMKILRASLPLYLSVRVCYNVPRPYYMGRQRCPALAIRYSEVEFPGRGLALWSLTLVSGVEDWVPRDKTL